MEAYLGIEGLVRVGSGFEDVRRHGAPTLAERGLVHSASVSNMCGSEWGPSYALIREDRLLL